ncbi:MAG: hypothetical protein NVSMB9_27770 [Isosphaeraceae bacterium]
MSGNRGPGWARVWGGVVLLAVALGTVGVLLAPVALAQEARGKGGARGKGKAGMKKAPNAADPLGVLPKGVRAAPGVGAGAGESFHYRLKIQNAQETSLAASYYPARADTTSPVVLLVHEKDRSSKDFDDPIDELKRLGLAEHLQSVGYAVLTFDLRGHGANVRRAVADRDWVEMTEDLQILYLFLLDRHNRGELNLSKLGVLALGEGANLVAAWASLPGAAISHEGRESDLAAMVLISPILGKEGMDFATSMNAVASRIPVLLLAGERDALSRNVVRRVRANVEKTRPNHVEVFPSSLHGYKLLRLEPKVTANITRFLETTVKSKPFEWEPRYNLTPVTYNDIQIVRHPREADRAKDAVAPKEKKKDARPRAKEKEEAGLDAPAERVR